MRLVGIALVALHALAFVVLADRFQGTEFSVDLRDGSVPAPLASRVTTAKEGVGIERRTWSIRYRGGYSRTIGAAQLVGPFQDPAARACSGRVAVSQHLLDQFAKPIEAQLTAELRGEGFVGIGDFRRVADLRLRWAQLATHPEDKRLVKAAPHGYVRATAIVRFERVDVPLVLALLPEVKANAVKFTIFARAKLDFDNRVVQWLSNKLGGDRLATSLTRRQIDQGIVAALEPPPAFALDGQTITFTYCDGAPEIVEGAYGALPFAVMIGESKVLPPKRGWAPKRAIDPAAALAIDLDLDALNALLYELWRTSYLDKRLAAAGLDRRFNEDPIVTEYLSVRITSPRLALPPVLSARGAGLRLSADARVGIDDRGTRTVGHVWGGIDVTFGELSADLGALELSCERTEAVLVPCYADLVAAIRERGREFHGELTETLATLINDIFVDRRLSDSALPADLVIRRARPAVLVSGDNASLHLDLDAELVSRP